MINMVHIMNPLSNNCFAYILLQYTLITYYISSKYVPSNFVYHRSICLQLCHINFFILLLLIVFLCIEITITMK